MPVRNSTIFLPASEIKYLPHCDDIPPQLSPERRPHFREALSDQSLHLSAQHVRPRQLLWVSMEGGTGAEIFQLAAPEVQLMVHDHVSLLLFFGSYVSFHHRSSGARLFAAQTEKTTALNRIVSFLGDMPRYIMVL